MKPGKPLARKTPLSPGQGFKPRTCQLDQFGKLTAKPLRQRKPMKKGKPKSAPNAHEGAYMGHVAALGCALCRRLGFGPTPAEVHHPRRGAGAGQRSSHYDTIPLCPEHHRGDTGIHGMGVKAWMAHYGLSEADLTAETRAALAAYLPPETDS